jgi:hypothetical protein
MYNFAEKNIDKQFSVAVGSYIRKSGLPKNILLIGGWPYGPSIDEIEKLSDYDIIIFNNFDSYASAYLQ